MAIKYLSGKRLQGTAAERTALNISSPPATSWKELGRTTLTGTSSTIEVTGFTAKDNIMILGHQICNTDHHTTYSTGTGSYSGNYSDRRSENGGSEATTINRTTNGIISDALTKDTFIVGEMVNITGQEKQVNWDMVGNNSSGVSNAPDRYETVGKFTGSAQINRMKFNNSSSVNNEIGSEVVILGCDNDEADSGTNFWQELADVSAGGSSTTLTTGTITDKRYLYFRFWCNNFVGGKMLFNSDSGSNYRRRYSANGNNDVVNNATSGFGLYYDLAPAMTEGYIINKSDKEKLVIFNTSETNNQSGANNTPYRMEGVVKWANTSDSITEISFTKNSNFSAGNRIQVWGSD